MTDFLNEFLAREKAGTRERLPTSYKALVSKAVARNAERMAQSALGRRIKDVAGFEVDMEAGQLTLHFDADDPVTLPAQVAGTYASDGFFMWGWSHPSVPPKMAEAARAVHQFATRQNIADLRDRKAQVTPKRAEDFAALAAFLSNASGTYVGDYGSGHVYLAYYEEDQE